MKEKKKNQLKRLVIAQNDLSQARSFCNYIERKKLFNPSSNDERLVRRALDTAIVVAYSRPFKGGKRNNSSVPSMMTGKYMSVLTDEEKELHKRMLKRRSSEYAHSDAEAYNVKFYVTDAPELPFNFMIPSSRNPHAPIPQNELKSLELIIEKILAFSFEKSRELSEELFPDNLS